MSTTWIETENGCFFPEDIFEWLKTQGIEYKVRSKHVVLKKAGLEEIGGDKTNGRDPSPDRGFEPET